MGKARRELQPSYGRTWDALLLGHSDSEAAQVLSLPLLEGVAVLGRSVGEFWSSLLVGWLCLRAGALQCHCVVHH